MREKYLDLETLSNLVNKSNLAAYEFDMIINLYETYQLVWRYFNSAYGEMNSLKDSCIVRKMNAFEDKIYTIGENTFSDKERIVLELLKIEEYVNSDDLNINKEFKKFVLNELEQLKKIVNLNEYYDTYYLKKRVSLLQACLGLKRNFFNAAIDLLEDKVTKMQNDLELQKQRYKK